MSETKDKSLRGALAGSGSLHYEALVGLLSGVVFGLVSPIVGHPFDTVKTRMQADSAHNRSSILRTVSGIWRAEGITGFYRGFLPMLAGSMVYRGALFSAYSAAYAGCEHVSVLNEPIPFTGGLRPSVLVGAMAAAATRATLESPLDFIKVRRQIGKDAMTDAVIQGHQPLLRSVVASPVASIRHLYHGYMPTLFRTMGLVGSFFIMVDYSVRYIPDVVNAPLFGPFFKGSVCATCAWVVAFPFETTKSVIQSDTTGRYKEMRNATWKVMREIYAKKGLNGLYRGLGPGAGRSFFANGASMVAYAWLQDTLRKQ